MLVKLQALSPLPTASPTAHFTQSKTQGLQAPKQSALWPFSPLLASLEALPPPYPTSVPSTQGIPAPLTHKAHSYPRVFALPIPCPGTYPQTLARLTPTSAKSCLKYCLLLRPMVAALFKITTRNHAASPLHPPYLVLFFCN